ncbi:MAG: hypothetical protein M3429_04250 [Verrucomicrobiota bacterium]|jgi:hypothetical protein|nr:hypothetical protein [Verrucomicrobiota bacterium]
MGGEYLPDPEATETEIARIELESTTSDVISIRAVPDPAGFRYCIVDEYETDFEQPFETSERPLTLKELIDFIDGSGLPEFDGGLTLAYNNANVQDSDRASLRHFTTITSGFYLSCTSTSSASSTSGRGNRRKTIMTSRRQFLIN